MTNIKILKNNNQICGLECSGHSGYSEMGSDIVCASVSALVCNCLLGFVNLGVKFEHKQNDKQGYFKLFLKNHDEKARFLLETTIQSLKEIEKQYKKYVVVNE